MKLRKRRVFLWLTIASMVVLIGCTKAHNSSQFDSIDLTSAKPTPTQEKEKIPSELTNNEGWHVPLPLDRKTGPKSVGRFTTAQGKPVDVNMTALMNRADYRFRYGSVTNEQKPYVFEGELKLIGLKQLSVKQSVFAYTILAQKVEDDKHGGVNNSHNHPFFYEILDKDGDGKFETLLLAPSNSLVPEWALK